MKTTLKDWPKVYRKLKTMRSFTNDERILFARAAAATPEERWEMNVNCIRALGFPGRVRSVRELERQKAKLRRLESPRLWKLRLSDKELAAGKLFGARCLKTLSANRES